MTDVTCPFTSPACPGWKPNSGEFGSGREGSGLHAPTLLAQAPERCGEEGLWPLADRHMVGSLASS